MGLYAQWLNNRGSHTSSMARLFHPLSQMASFVPGRILSEGLYREVVRPMLDPILPHAAGLLGAGSDVLGLDTEMSMDHDWGPRLQLFVKESGLSRIEALLADLPCEYKGFPTFEVGSEPSHRVETTTPSAFFLSYLGFDPTDGIAPADWLATPEQKLLTIAKGPLFHDSLGLDKIKKRLAYYPDDVWRYQLASVWERIGQEEHLVGRAGFVGDELGASIIAARLVRDMMRLAFLMERTYAPYPKWFGTAFSRLKSAPELTPLLQSVLDARGWQERDARLVPAYEAVARMQNRLGLTEPLPEQARPFFDRPFSVIHLHAGFASALVAGIQDPEVRAIAERRKIGGIDVFSDSTDLISHAEWRTTVRTLYRSE